MPIAIGLEYERTKQTVNENSELLAEAWDELEAALGGRFRNGAECPYVLELFRLAFADARSEAAEPDAEFLRGHLEVCPVCRHRYRAALVAASENVGETTGDLAAAVSAAYPNQAGPVQGSMLDEFTRVPVPPDALLPKNDWMVSEPAGITGTANDSLMTAGSFLGEKPSAAADPADTTAPLSYGPFEVAAEDKRCKWSVGDASAVAGQKAVLHVEWRPEGCLQVGLGGFLALGCGYEAHAQWFSADGSTVATESVADRVTLLRLRGSADRPPRAGDALMIRHVRRAPDDGAEAKWDVSVRVEF